MTATAPATTRARRGRPTTDQLTAKLRNAATGPAMLRAARHREDITAVELAARLGTGAARHIWEIESGTRKADPDTVLRICRALGTDPAPILVAFGYPEGRVMQLARKVRELQCQIDGVPFVDDWERVRPLYVRAARYRQAAFELRRKPSARKHPIWGDDDGSMPPATTLAATLEREADVLELEAARMEVTS